MARRFEAPGFSRPISRRSFVAGTMGLFSSALLAACGGDDDDDNEDDDTAQSDAEPTATEASDGGSESDEEPTSADDNDEGEGDSGDVREIEHAYGSVEVPAMPESIVTLDYFALETLLALDLTPVGVSLNGTIDAQHEYIRDRLDGITAVGETLSEPDLEQIARLEPDLILGLDLFVEDIRDALEEIAPVVAFQFESSAQWKDIFKFYAEAVGQTENAEAVMAEYDDRVETLRQTVGADELAALEASVVRVNEDDLRIYNQPTFIGVILEDIGLGRPESQRIDEFSTTISREQIRDADADLLFLWGGALGQNEQNEQLAELEDDPVFGQLESVQSDRAFFVDGDTWIGSCILAAHSVLDDLFEIFERIGVTDSDSDEATFPATIENKFGTTEIPEEPERVLTIGYSEQDPVLALGVKPVAVREWFGEQPHAVWPWAEDELGDAEPEVLVMAFGELDFEEIAALDPDLIVATHSGIVEEEYTTLAEIAPTLAQPDDYPDFGVPWQEQTRLIGRALGREAQAEELIAEVEEYIDRATEDHPEFDGATIAWASPAGDGQYWAVGASTPPMQFLQDLGFELVPELDELVGDADSAEVSAEQMGLLDADVLIMQVRSEEERAAIEEDPLYQQLNAAQEGRTIFFVGQDDPLYGALSFSTVLSLPFAVDNLVPLLEAAVDGDPGF
ncbi:MAG: ABC transporter substrate-binding protein [Chloroflexota bacterium]